MLSIGKMRSGSSPANNGKEKNTNRNNSRKKIEQTNFIQICGLGLGIGAQRFLLQWELLKTQHSPKVNGVGLPRAVGF
jgi:hypothetical protein